jgi:hypothetical protein
VAADGNPVACVADVLDLIEAQNVGSERSQSRKDAWLAANAAVIFAEAHVANVVQPVLDRPMVPDGLRAK